MEEIFLKWQPGFNLGIPEVDKQHKKIIELINDLNQAFIKDNTSKKIGNILDEMSSYATEHFKTEEDLFKKTNFPLSKEHIAQHAYFVNKVEDFKRNFSDGQSITFRLMKFLRSWWTNHILDSDREYVEIIKSSNT